MSGGAAAQDAHQKDVLPGPGEGRAEQACQGMEADGAQADLTTMTDKKVVIGVMALAALLLMAAGGLAEEVYCGYYAPLLEKGLTHVSYESYYCSDTKVYDDALCCPVDGAYQSSVTNAPANYYGGEGEPRDREDCRTRFTDTQSSLNIDACKPENKVWCLDKANLACIHVSKQECQGPIKEGYGNADSDACNDAKEKLKLTGFVPPQIPSGATTGKQVLGFRVTRTTIDATATTRVIPQLTLEWTPYRCDEFTIQKRACSSPDNCAIPPGEEKTLQLMEEIYQKEGVMYINDRDVEFDWYYSYRIKPACGEGAEYSTTIEGITPGNSGCAGGPNRKSGPETNAIA